MPKTKAQKQETIDRLANDLERQHAMVFVDVKGLNVKAIASLRKQLKGMGAQITVIKKTLFQRALEGKSIDLDSKKLEGQVGVVFAFHDAVEPVRLVHGVSKKEENLKMIGGYFENEFRSLEVMKEIAQLPSREQLLARLAGSLQSPLQGLRTVLEGNLKGLVYILSVKET